MGQPCFKPVSRQNKFTSGPFNASIGCADKAAVTDYRNYIWLIKLNETKGFFCFSLNKRSPEES